MDKLNVYTDIYTKELIIWAKTNKYEHKIYDKGYRGKGYFVEIENSAKSKKSLSYLLEEVILFKNPVTRGYSSLCDSIKKLVFLPCRNDIYKVLSEFLEEHDSINIEGYTNFRMDEYTHLVNIVLYAIVKKSL